MKMISAAALALLAATPAFAGNTLLDFERVTSFASISEFYNGGADGAGQVGPALGISFTGDALGLVNDFSSYFSHAPSPVGVMTAVGADATMNVAAGFTEAIAFSYSSSAFVPLAVSVWSGLGGSGELLASFNLVSNAQRGCNDSDYCRFDQLASTFAGTAHSVTFGNAANVAAFDDISIGVVPEPSAALLLSLGITGLFLARRRA